MMCRLRTIRIPLLASMPRVAILGGILLCSALTDAEPAKPACEAILDASDAAPKDLAVQERALARIDAEIVAHPKDALNHYVRGRILSRLGRNPEALAAYEEALGRDSNLASAHYNAGVVLTRLDRMREAAQRFDRALEMDPSADAAYNAGQAYYGLKDFERSRERFRRAQQLAPGDFNAAKKLMQAQLALGREAEAWETRKRVIGLWKASRDPEVRALRSYVLDQFEVGTLHVLAYENLAPAEDLAYIYTFQVFGPDEKVVGSVQLETSAVIRERGVPYLMGVSRGAGHEQAGIAFKSLPRYSEVKALAQKLIAERLTP
jgi:tetratricopeptide (TPR) repeat protein